MALVSLQDLEALKYAELQRIAKSAGLRANLRVPLAKFQELRYNVALILKEMNDLEKRSVLKIQD